MTNKRKFKFKGVEYYAVLNGGYNTADGFYFIRIDGKDIEKCSDFTVRSIEKVAEVERKHNGNRQGHEPFTPFDQCVKEYLESIGADVSKFELEKDPDYKEGIVY